MGTVPIAISVETSAKAPIPGRAVIHRSIQRSLSRTRTVALGILRAAAADSCDSALGISQFSIPVMIPVMEPAESELIDCCVP